MVSLLSVDYDTANSVLDALASKSVDISLLDAFVTAAKNDKIEQKKLKVKEVIKSTSANGIVLSHELVRLEEDFKSQIASKQNIITEFVSNMTNLLKVKSLLASSYTTHKFLVQLPICSLFFINLKF